MSEYYDIIIPTTKKTDEMYNSLEFLVEEVGINFSPSVYVGVCEVPSGYGIKIKGELDEGDLELVARLKRMVEELESMMYGG